MSSEKQTATLAVETSPRTSLSNTSAVVKDKSEQQSISGTSLDSTVAGQGTITSEKFTDVSINNNNNNNGEVEESSNLEKLATAKSVHPEDAQRIQTREDGTEYPTGMKLGLIVFALCLVVFLMALDNAIITTAIPKISDEFNSLSDVGWYGSAYLLTQASLQLLFGKFYTFMSIKWVFITAISIFEIGSLVCGVAPNSVALILGRAIAGLGAAGIMSGGLLILAHSVPLAKRPLYTGLIGGMFGIASVAGPLLGGAFTDHVTWRWCFYINLPIGAVTLAVIIFFFQDPTNPNSQTQGGILANIRKFDPIGTFLFMPAVISLLLALQWGGNQYAWNDGRIIGLFVVFGILIIGFVAVQIWQQENATVPPRILTANRTVWSAGIFTFAMGATFFILIYYLPIWFQAVQGVSAVESGIRNLPMLIANILASIISGAAVTIWGYYAPFMVASTVLMSIGAGLLSTLNPGSGTGAWIGYQIVFGLGAGMGIQQPLMAVQTVLDIRDVPTGTALVVFLQSLGGALFVAVGQTVFTNKLAEELVENLPGVDPVKVLTSGATNLLNIITPEQIPAAALSYSNALTTTFLVGAGLAAFSVFGSSIVEWKSVKGKKIEAGMA